MNLLRQFYDFIESSIPLGGGDFRTCRRKLRNNNNSIFDYFFVMSLDEKEYPKYLKEAFFVKFGKKLDLKSPKTFNEKIQWLKIYDNKPIKAQLTDKIIVRDYVKEKIGEEYLKPVLQICNSFSEINFENLPDSFIIKCNHGCKWHFIVKNKRKFLQQRNLFNLVNERITGWLSQNFFGWSNFETQYKQIQPKIIIEPLLRDNIDEFSTEIEVYVFNGKARIIQQIRYTDYPLTSVYDDTLQQLDFKFKDHYKIFNHSADNNVYDSISLSERLADKKFKLVRVDWLVYKNKLYFNEMTFTPFSGFIDFPDEYIEWNKKLGKMLDLKGN